MLKKLLLLIGITMSISAGSASAAQMPQIPAAIAREVQNIRTQAAFRTAYPGHFDNFQWYDGCNEECQANCLFKAQEPLLSRYYNETLPQIEKFDRQQKAPAALAALRAKFPMYFDPQGTIKGAGACPNHPHANRMQGIGTVSTCPDDCKYSYNTQLRVQQRYEALGRINRGQEAQYYNIDQLLDGTDEFVYGKPITKYIKEAAVATAWASADFVWPIEDGEGYGHQYFDHNPSSIYRDYTHNNDPSVLDKTRYLIESTRKSLMLSHWLMAGGGVALGYVITQEVKKALAAIKAENKENGITLTRAELSKAVAKRAWAKVKATKITDQKVLLYGGVACAAGTVATGILNTTFGSWFIEKCIPKTICSILLPKFGKEYSDSRNDTNWRKAITHWIALAGGAAVITALAKACTKNYVAVVAENAAQEKTMSHTELCKAVINRTMTALRGTTTIDQKILVGGAATVAVGLVAKLFVKLLYAPDSGSQYERRGGFWSNVSRKFTNVFAKNSHDEYDDEDPY
jgi:hypothetical protein